MTGRLSAVDMQDLAGDEGRLFEEQHGVDDIVDLAHASHGIQAGQGRVRRLGMHGGLDDARRHRIEAQAAGVPVVTSSRGGAGEAIEDGVTGYGFAESDVEGLSAALIRLLHDDALAAAMSTAARERACRLFDLQKCTGQLESLYDQSVLRR